MTHSGGGRVGLAVAIAVVVVLLGGGLAAFVLVGRDSTDACDGLGLPVVRDGEVVDGSISEGGTDRWCVALGSDTRLTARVQSEVDTTLRVFDHTEVELAFDDDTYGLDPEISEPFPAGAYIVEVAAWSKSASGTYTLRVVIGGAPTQTTTQIGTDSGTGTGTGCTGEPVLDFGDSSSAFLDEGGDARWCVVVDTAGPLVARVRSDVDTTLTLIDERGAEIGFDDDTYGLDPEISTRVEPGTYLLVVEAWAGMRSGQVGIELRSR